MAQALQRRSGPLLADPVQQARIIVRVIGCQQGAAHRVQALIATGAVVELQVVLGQLVGGGDLPHVPAEVAEPLGAARLLMQNPQGEVGPELKEALPLGGHVFAGLEEISILLMRNSQL